MKHRTRPPAHGYKAHIAADKDSGIIRKVETTPANEPDVAIAPSIIPDKPGGENSARGILGGEVMPTGPMRCRSKRRLKPRGNRKAFAQGHRWLSAEKLEAHNRPPRPIRVSVAGLSTNSFFIASREGICLETPCFLARIEKIFGTWKRSYHFRSMRWLGLVKARLQVHLAAIAYNVKRHWRLQTA